MWCNNNIGYLLWLAKHVGRRDMWIVGINAFDDGMVRLRGLSHIVLDHASELTPEQRREFNALISRRAAAS